MIHSDIRRTTIKQKQKKKNDLFQRNVWLTIALAIGSLPVESRELMDINIMATASTVGESSNRMSTFKNKGLNMEDCRKKRQEEGIQLRKSRREEQVGIYLLAINMAKGSTEGQARSGILSYHF